MTATDGCKMGRYFFDLLEDGKLAVDAEGTELDDLDAAAVEAAQAIAEYALDVLPAAKVKRLTMTVRDDSGERHFELDLVFDVRALRR
jgi:hypothetical protein